ncbi:MAG: group 1 glycosyl transferase, partial [Flavobacteriaceae bacterium]|nr:group 1 glycosyl transferase [Flavobacteriaceae bacterium]
TSQAILGISIEEDIGLNYRYALPNKLFDYIQAKIPVLVSNLPEMSNLVSHYKIGEIIIERNPITIAKLIESMIENKNLYLHNLEIAAKELIWENEKVKLINILKEIENK